MRAIVDPDRIGYRLEGTQRLIKDPRLKEIAGYIDRIDAAFPNSIILAGNYDHQSGFSQGELEYMEGEERGAIIDQSKVWTVTEVEGGCHKLYIPTGDKLAAVIDGQHRLFAFADAGVEAMRSMNLLCSIYLGLPKALQAQIFAVINSTQKRVDRSLTYELFGYNVSDEGEEYWTPDKLAVFLTRKLGTDPYSPLQGRIVVAPQADAALRELTSIRDWRVSTAVVVDGILRLFSSNPKRDANSMKQDEVHSRAVLRSGPLDRSPLRDVYIEGNDALIYKMVVNYLRACDEVFWSNVRRESFIVRTVGVQALFDVLRKLAVRAYADRDVSASYFVDKIASAGSIDFSDRSFRNPSGSGRTVIRKAIEDKIGLG